MDRSAGHAARHHAQHHPRELNGTRQRLMQWPEVPVKAEVEGLDAPPAQPPAGSMGAKRGSRILGPMPANFTAIDTFSPLPKVWVISPTPKLAWTT